MVDEFLVISMGLGTVLVARRLQTTHSLSFRLTHLPLAASASNNGYVLFRCPEESTYEDFGGGDGGHNRTGEEQYILPNVTHMSCLHTDGTTDGREIYGRRGKRSRG
jgi:hypothetical protein